jgi:hypothetical protein
MKYCSNCNRENKPEASYCRGCGQKFDNPSTTPSTSITPTLPSHKMASSAPSLKTIAVLGGALLGGLWLLSRQNSTIEKKPSPEQEKNQEQHSGVVSPLPSFMLSQMMASHQEQLREDRKREERKREQIQEERKREDHKRQHLREDQKRDQIRQDHVRQDQLRQDMLRQQVHQDMMRQQLLQDQLRQQQLQQDRIRESHRHR